MDAFQKTCEKMKKFNPVEDIAGAIIMFLTAMIFYIIDGYMAIYGVENIIFSSFIFMVICTPVTKFAIYLTVFSMIEIWR